MLWQTGACQLNPVTHCKSKGHLTSERWYFAVKTAAGYHSIYQKIQDLIKDEDAWFFDLLKCDYMLACFGLFSFDVVAFDNHLSKLDPEYDSINCTYKGLRDISTGEYILRKYGKRHFEMVQRLLSN